MNARLIILGVFSVTVLFSAFAVSQAKIGYIDSDAIMKRLPEAQDAQKKLDGMVAEWKTQLAKLEDEWKQKYDQYEKKKLVMTEQRRADAERDLQTLDRKIADFRNQKFGQSGELFQKQNDLMKPIQDRIFNVLQAIAQEDNYDYVFDKSGQILILYAKEQYDLTNRVLDKLGVSTAAPK
jgi:outer membrane protein